MSDQPPYPPNQPDEPGWGQQPPPNQPGDPGWGQQPPPPPGWGQQPGPGSGGPQGYTPTAAIGYGWKAFQANAGPLLAVAAIVLIGGIVANLLMGLIFGGNLISFDTNDGFEFNALALIGNLVSQLVALILSAAAVRIALDVVDGRGVNLGEMFSRFDLVQVIIAGVLVSIATTIGLVLCVLPGLAVIVLTWFTNYFIIGKGEDAITAIKSSVNLVTNNLGAVLLFALLSFACMIGGTLACCVGLLVAFPVVLVGAAYTFRDLQGEPVAQL